MKYTVHPYRLHTYFAIPMVLFAIFCCYLSCQLLDDGNRSFAIGYLLFGGACLLLGKYLRDTAQNHAEFTEEGVTVTQGKAAPVFLPWTAISFACKTRSRKGHPCIILSETPLEAEQAKKLAQKSAMTDKLYVDGSVVLFLQQLKDPSQPETILSSRLHIREYP